MDPWLERKLVTCCRIRCLLRINLVPSFISCDAVFLHGSGTCSQFTWHRLKLHPRWHVGLNFRNNKLRLDLEWDRSQDADVGLTISAEPKSGAEPSQLRTVVQFHFRVFLLLLARETAIAHHKLMRVLLLVKRQKAFFFWLDTSFHVRKFNSSG